MFLFLKHPGYNLKQKGQACMKEMFPICPVKETQYGHTSKTKEENSLITVSCVSQKKSFLSRFFGFIIKTLCKDIKEIKMILMDPFDKVWIVWIHILVQYIQAIQENLLFLLFQTIGLWNGLFVVLYQWFGLLILVFYKMRESQHFSRKCFIFGFGVGS